MIQRIQSLFLLIAFILQLLMLFLPIAEYVVGNQVVIFKASGFISESTLNKNMAHSTYILVLLCLLVLIPFVAIFLYKRRKSQMQLCIYYIIVLIGFQAVIFWFSWNTMHQLEAVVSYKFPIIFPVVSAILSYLAFLSVRKDERLIRSIDRIR
jgi:hypothetical protein